jgi:histidine ammonia-lyase
MHRGRGAGRGAKCAFLGMTIFLSVVLATPPVQAYEAGGIELGSGRLTVEQVVEVARGQASISVSSDTMERVGRGFDVVLEAARQNVPVYGLTVGVGLNKDKKIFKEENGQRVISEEVFAVSRQFNLNSLRSHAGGAGEPMPAEVVRAGMLIRLNTILRGACGAQRDVAQRYVDFLNKGIVPVVPSMGTVGEADITLASHIGLVMVGEWEAFYQGRRMSGAEALNAAGLQPLRPVGKDFLCIISNNGLVVGDAVLGVHDAEQYLHRAATVFALSLEGLNGNVAPFLDATTKVRPFPGLVEAAGLVRGSLAGSSLWTMRKDRALQDPLSYRDMAYTLGNALDAVRNAKQMVVIAINHTEDNPMVALDVTEAERPGSTQMDSYLVGGKTNGAIYPTANFEPLPVVSAVERASLALGTFSDASTMNILRLVEPEISHLSRFLAAPTNEGGHAFGAIQKSFVALNNVNRTLAMPVSLNSVAIAGNIEDRATHSQLAAANMRKLVANLYELSSFQLLHATQAVDLRKDFTLGERTGKMHAAYRNVVPFVDRDRIFTPDIQQGVALLQSWPVDTIEGGYGDNGRTPRGGVASGFGGTASGMNGWLLPIGGLTVVVSTVFWVLRRRAHQ